MRAATSTLSAAVRMPRGCPPVTRTPQDGQRSHQTRQHVSAGGQSAGVSEAHLGEPETS